MEPWQIEAVTAQKRRQDALDAFFVVPAVNDSDLPLDLRSYPKTSGLLTEDELDIVETDAETLLHRIKDRQLTSVDVTKAFSKMAVVAQNLVCCFLIPSVEWIAGVGADVNSYAPLDKLCN